MLGSPPFEFFLWRETTLHLLTWLRIRPGPHPRLPPYSRQLYRQLLQEFNSFFRHFEPEFCLLVWLGRCQRRASPLCVTSQRLGGLQFHKAGRVHLRQARGGIFQLRGMGIFKGPISAYLFLSFWIAQGSPQNAPTAAPGIPRGNADIVNYCRLCSFHWAFMSNYYTLFGGRNQLH